MASRARKLEVGQIWTAAYINSEERITGYDFKLVHEDRYWEKGTNIWRKCWLGLKLGIEKDPHVNFQVQTWWFDDRGTCTDKDGNFQFILIRKRT